MVHIGVAGQTKRGLLDTRDALAGGVGLLDDFAVGLGLGGRTGGDEIVVNFHLCAGEGRFGILADFLEALDDLFFILAGDHSAVDGEFAPVGQDVFLDAGLD